MKKEKKAPENYENLIFGYTNEGKKLLSEKKDKILNSALALAMKNNSFTPELQDKIFVQLQIQNIKPNKINKISPNLKCKGIIYRLKPFLKRYWAKNQYNEIFEIFAFNKKQISAFYGSTIIEIRKV